MLNRECELVEMSDGAFLYAEHYPNPGRPLVVMIPGFCCTCRSFDKNAEVIAQNYEVVVYDPRGQGKSSKGLQGHTVSRNAQDIKEIIKHYGNKHAAVLAWSMAGQFIMEYVHLYGTENLFAIIMADCPLHASGSEPWNAHGLRNMNLEHFNEHLMMSYNNWREYCHGFAEKIWSGIDDERIAKATQEFAQTPPWIAFAIYSDLVCRNGYPYLAQANVPMLFTGADSRVTENGKLLAAKWYPAARSSDMVSESCTFENGGHVFFDVEAERFNARLMDFLNRFSELNK